METDYLYRNTKLPYYDIFYDKIFDISMDKFDKIKQLNGLYGF